MGVIGAGEVSRRLEDRLAELVRTLLSDVREEGHELKGLGPDGGAWSIVMRGPKRGVFCNWLDPTQTGDALELVRWAACQGDRGRAYRWSLDWLGLGGRPFEPGRAGGNPAGNPAARAAAQAERAVAEAAAEAEQRRRAKGMWLAGSAELEGSPVASYLAGRGLPLAAFAAPHGPPLGRALRCLREAWHVEARRFLPAMAAAIVRPDTGEHVATHLTFLERAAGLPAGLPPERCGSGGEWRKLGAPGPPKKVRGRYAGGLIPLTRGQSGRRLAQAPDDDLAVIGEGIETTLTGALLYPAARALAAVSAGNLAELALPPAIGRIWLLLDRDGENDAVGLARERAVERWTQEGRTVELVTPRQGFKDLNDGLQATLARASA